jgi:hypothetical protein
MDPNMARSRKDLKRLADELAALTDEDRAAVLAEALGRRRPRPLPRGFKPPTFPPTGEPWTGGSLRREEMYGDDER